MFRALARMAYRHHWKVLAITVLVGLAAGFVGGPIAGLLKAGGFDDPASENVAARQALESGGGGDPTETIIALVHTDYNVVADSQAAAEVARVHAILAGDPGVGSVRDITEVRDPRLVSRDGHTTYLVAVPKPGTDDQRVATAHRLQNALGDDPHVTFGGQVVAQDQLGEQVRKDLGHAELLAFPILFLLLVFVFRSPVAAVLPLVVGALTVVLTFTGLRAVNNVTEVSIFALNLCTGLGLGLAIDYSLLMVSRYREELDLHGPGWEAMRRTLSSAGRTVAFSSLTVTAALASLLVFPLNFLWSMGAGGVLVTLSAATVALTVLPAILALLGRRIDALSIRPRSATSDATAGGWYRLAHGVMRRPLLIIVATGAALIVLGLPFLRIQFTSVDATDLPATASARMVDTALRQDFAGYHPSQVVIAVHAPRSDAAGAASIVAQVAKAPGVAGVGPAQPISDGVWRIDAQLADSNPFSTASRNTLASIRAISAPYHVEVAGQTASFEDLQTSLRNHVPAALLIVALATMVLLFAATGSIVLPLKSLMMNVLSLSATFGTLVLVFQDGRLQDVLGYTSQGALESTQPVLLFAIAFGLSTDYGVFLLTRIREAYTASRDTRESVAFGLERTGRIVTAAAALFCVAIGTFATSQVIFIKEVGIGTGLAVLIDATIVRALLVPSLMAVLGDWNWWSPRPLAWLHARLGLDRIEGGGEPDVAAPASPDAPAETPSDHSARDAVGGSISSRRAGAGVVLVAVGFAAAGVALLTIAAVRRRR